MSVDLTPQQLPAISSGASGVVVAGPWPSYAAFSHLPERDRWVIYGQAKASRYAQEQSGIPMGETYDSFISRICRELDL